MPVPEQMQEGVEKICQADQTDEAKALEMARTLQEEETGTDEGKASAGKVEEEDSTCKDGGTEKATSQVHEAAEQVEVS